MKILLLGRGEIGYKVMSRILEKGYDVPFIVTTRHTSEVGRTLEDFQKLAELHKIPFYFTANIHTEYFVNLFNEAKADLGIAISWVQVIKKDIIQTARLGFLNLHGGDLPRYRGNACGNWAILQGEKKLGICVHFMEPDSLDSGDILLKRYIPITSRTTIGELTSSASQIGIEMILNTVDMLEKGKAHPKKQDNSKALRCYPRLPRDGEIDWNQSVPQIDRHIRSVSEPYPGAITYYNGEKLYIWRAYPLKNPPNHLAVPGQIIGLQKDDTVLVATGRGGVLVLETVQLEGGEKVKPRLLIKSIRARLGLAIGEEIINLKKQVRELETLINKRREEH